MTNRKLLVAGAAVGAVALAAVAYAFFLPEADTILDEALPADGDARALKTGTFAGADRAHRVEGTVTLYEGADGHFLRFEDYDATDGPDVYFYLVRDAGASSRDAVEGDGLLVRVPGGTEGRATVRGTFNVPLPADFDPSLWNGVAVWCDRFDALFGDATLNA